MDPSELIQLEKEWDRAWANYDYIFIQGKKPIRRRHKNKWTDADPDEINKISKSLNQLFHFEFIGRMEHGNFVLDSALVDTN